MAEKPLRFVRPEKPRAFTRKDMRRMLTLSCRECQHRWLAPTLGRCPKCHGEQARQVEARLNDLVRT